MHEPDPLAVFVQDVAENGIEGYLEEVGEGHVVGLDVGELLGVEMGVEGEQLDLDELDLED